MRLKMLSASLLFSIGAAFAQSNDPVIMTINGKSVYRSEFEYSYNKNNSGNVIDKKTVKEYLPLFVNYKLKVEDALTKKLDTITSFKNEYLMYRDQQIKPTLINEDDVMNFARRMYDDMKNRVGDDGWFVPAHIYIRVKQKATKAEQEAAKVRIDSIYNAIYSGEGDPKDNFVRLANECSDDIRTAKQGGVLGWLYKGQLMKEFDERMLKMEKGEISKPFMTAAGYHIMLLVNKRPVETFGEALPGLMQYIEGKNLRDNVADEKIDSIVKASNGTYTKEQLMDKYAEELKQKDADFKNLINEYHDGLLLYEVSSREVWGLKGTNKKELTKFFKKNKKRYAWDEPRFKGIAYHAKEEADIEAVKKSIKKVDFDEWAGVLRKTFNNDSILRIRVEKGIFKKGDNGLVDRDVFGIKDAKVDSIKRYPYNSTFGKILKKGPECMEDVKGLVTADYQDMLEKEWVKHLRETYIVEIKEDVLETVNNHGK